MSCSKAGGKLPDWYFASTCNFALSVSSTLELPDTDCKQSAPGSGTPLGRGAEGNWGRHAVLARIDKGVKRHCVLAGACLAYSKVWSVRNRGPRVARLDSLYCIRNQPLARLDS